MHATVSKGEDVLAGCIRGKTETYLVIEVFIIELIGFSAKRIYEEKLGVSPIVFSDKSYIQLQRTASQSEIRDTALFSAFSVCPPNPVVLHAG